jgi:uncharacterized membrane protein YozB (DUF420 family)
VAGVRQARRGDVARHRRSMLLASALVVAFVLSYVAKLALLGREDFSTWSRWDVNTLRVHETCVLAMLLGGGFALTRAWRMRRSRLVTRNPADDPPEPGVLKAHRIAGRVAVTGALLGWLTAVLVLVGMIGRLPD